MSSKGPWESRVGTLLKHEADFLWAFKPVDSPLYGGQTRIDWLACDSTGSFWLVEVKQLPEDRKSINLLTEVSPGQREALTAVGRGSTAFSLLAVGCGKTLYIFDWNRVSWQWQQRQDPPQGSPKPELQPLSEAIMTIEWTGKSGWESVRIRPQLSVLARVEPWRATPQIQIRPEKPSRKPASSRLISKPSTGGSPSSSLLRLVVGGGQEG